MTANKPVYKCPVCDYVTHFPKALEAHMHFRKHEAKQAEALVEVKEEPAIVAEVKQADETPVKKTRKPRPTKKSAKEQK